MSIKSIRTKLYTELKSKNWPEPTKELITSILSKEEVSKLEEIGMLEPNMSNPKAYYIEWKATATETTLEQRVENIENTLNKIYQLLLKSDTLF